MTQTPLKLLNISGGLFKKAIAPTKERSLFVCNCLNVRFMLCKPTSPDRQICFYTVEPLFMLL
ncbi:MAG: hypothetical protein RMY30_030000 [Nostoc sp. CmiSLP01]|nr:hypothetical protein [Nostoc sp. CmiSLP01]MDZ8289028.1 hypothetical protein [Nostoc sp. ChiSLP01]